MSWAEYKRAQMKDDLSDHGYSETPGERTISIMGDVANVQQRFTMNFRHRSPPKPSTSSAWSVTEGLGESCRSSVTSPGLTTIWLRIHPPTDSKHIHADAKEQHHFHITH